MTWFAIADDDGFQTIWRYFSWSNQTLAAIALWVAAAYLFREGKHRFGPLIAALPAAFMTAVSLTYILTAQEGLKLDQTFSCIAGTAAAAALLGHFLLALIRKRRLKKEG